MTFKFQNFNRFRYMYDQLKQPIEVSKPVALTGTVADYDNTGGLKKQYSESEKLVEPIVKDTVNSVTNPGDEFISEGGGTVKVELMEWVSVRFDFPRGTKVKLTDSGREYEVENYTPDDIAGLMTYYLRAVNHNGNL